jgi:hypothetical protein
MSEDTKITVLCLNDWELLFPRLEKMAAGFLKKKGVGEHDIGDVTSEWLEKLYRYSRYPISDALGYAAKALSHTYITWGKKHTRDNCENIVDINDISEEMPSVDMTPLDLVLDRERNIAMMRILNIMIDYTILNGRTSDACLINTLLSVMREENSDCIFSCCRIAAEKMRRNPRSVYRRFCRLREELRRNLQQSASFTTRLNDDLYLIGLADYSLSGCVAA